ncbi:YifB family Mg chelatase-like AAA ATPase [Aestuariirhabdus sp. Z084]|uniref:YifB family Mg chelatase-like AAA ATPase n=1 Tax=Aestuariirhabdus haliotis TaxID=2918751 RepID=UPI00201B3E97|nr:YifB family Mg chelatase-like AAA ATPase [Aestuariirhabdus haliotis]MCL6416559.1 YifB family Mg chelatase-like AAA ATPase [Aestuariirhabdus haliotis]MCL6420574.1 YifB family Mg chelatase-like AAA ATPase [Aestuariirhabdus haliotis]
MSLSIIYTRARVGVDAPLVTVETHLSNGLPSLSIVGLPESSVKEAKDRVRSALLNSGFQFPTRRITINLAPADLPKEGGRYDLPIALGILAASDQLAGVDLSQYEFIGELALSGELRPCSGSLSAMMAAEISDRTMVIPTANAAEGALLQSTRIVCSQHLLALCDSLIQNKPLGACPPIPDYETYGAACLADIVGQFQGKRALEVAASGGHSLLFYGPPGTGKTMLASRLPSILPPLARKDALQVANLYSIVNGQPLALGQRPFRSPHHSASSAALVGGGGNPRPGEISLAHQGVLFLDELPEFERRVLEVLREPLESGEIVISRAARQVTFPAQFQLVAAMNPCPCGYLGDRDRPCRCSPAQLNRYRQKLSGPLLDRIDMQVEVTRLPASTLAQLEGYHGEPSSEVRQRVYASHIVQQERQSCSNASLDNRQLMEVCGLGKPESQLLEQTIEKLGLSGRAYHRILRMARTLADLEKTEKVLKTHIEEAVSYRQLDRL